MTDRSFERLDRLLTARMGGRDAFDAMAIACEELVAQLGDARPPIKLAPLARLLGAKLNYGKVGFLGSEEAAIRLVENDLVLCVSREQFEKRPKRARFSIAHEIGHLLLFKMLGPEFLEHSDSQKTSYALTERLCDFAGARILMPRKMLIDAVAKRCFNLAGLREIEELFDVSSSALLKALADLVDSGGILELRKFRRRETEAITWRVWSASVSSTASGLGAWLPAGCTMKHISGLTTPGLLPLGEPVFHPEIMLNRGKNRTAMEGLAVRDICDTAPAQTDLLRWDRARLDASGLVQNEEAGRVTLIVGKRGCLNPPLFKTRFK